MAETETGTAPPSYAAQIWINGDGNICLTFPGYKGMEDRKFNTVTLDPHGEHTLTILRTVLKERASVENSPDLRKIGNKAAITQWQLDAMIKAMKVTKVEPKKDVSNVSVDDLLNDIGL